MTEGWRYNMLAHWFNMLFNSTYYEKHRKGGINYMRRLERLERTAKDADRRKRISDNVRKLV